jgi:hypothetical protein
VVEVGPVIDVFDRIMRDDREQVQYHFVLIDYLCRALGGRLMPGSDVTEAVVVGPAEIEPFALTGKARSVIARACEMRETEPGP